MQVPPGAVMDHALPATPGLSAFTGTSSGLPISGKVPQTFVPAPGSAFATASGALGALLTPCRSCVGGSMRLTVGTLVVDHSFLGIRSDVHIRSCLSFSLCHAAASNESLCASNTKLTGTTTVIAKSGQGVALRNMIATMPGDRHHARRAAAALS